MNENLDLFICAHKDFKTYPTNPVYKIIHGGQDISVPLEQHIETKTDLSDMEFSLAEGSRIYWLWKNWEVKDYIGICHYRKYFKFFDDVPDMDAIFKEHDVITTNLELPVSMYLAYSISHRIEDLIDVFTITKRLFPELADTFINDLKSSIIHPCNMFIMKREDFNTYCSTVFPIIQEFCKLRGWSTDKEINKFVTEHKQEYLKNIYPGNVIDYQARVLGFLLERLTSIFIDHHFKHPYIEEMVTTEEKYKTPSDKYEP